MYVGSPALDSCSGFGDLSMGLRPHTLREEDSAASLSLWLPSHIGVQVGSPSLCLLLSFLCVSYLDNFRSSILNWFFKPNVLQVSGKCGVGSKLMGLPTTLQPCWNLSSAKF